MDFNEITRRISEYDHDAGVFINQILAVSAVWDDLIDKDKHVSDSDINRAFTIALIHLPRNKFYATHFHDLNPLLVMAIENWGIANTIERNNMATMFQVSFIIRSSYVDLITMTAYILGGHELAHEIGLAARQFVHDEGIGGYLVALGKEECDRGRK